MEFGRTQESHAPPTLAEIRNGLGFSGLLAGAPTQRCTVHREHSGSVHPLGDSPMPSFHMQQKMLKTLQHRQSEPPAELVTEASSSLEPRCARICTDKLHHLHPRMFLRS